MDGGQFSSASLSLAHIDLVGRTYYNRAPSELLHDLSLVEGWNVAQALQMEQMEAIDYYYGAAAARSLHKLFVVKEFGLVSQGDAALVVPQDSAWIEVMVNIASANSASVAALYWSLRGHAAEGGFHDHYEWGGNITSLHWPGFGYGFPNYESETLSIILRSNNVSTPTSVGTPVLLPPEGNLTSPPCLRFYDTAGASYYELWAASTTTDMRAATDSSWPQDDRLLGIPHSTYSLNSSFSGGWLLVTEDISDAVDSRRALVSLAAATLENKLGYTGTGTLRFCLRGCGPASEVRDSRRLHRSIYDSDFDPTLHAHECFSNSSVWCDAIVTAHCGVCSNVVELSLATAAPEAVDSFIQFRESSISPLSACGTSEWTLQDYDALFGEWRYYSQLAVFSTLTGAKQLKPCLS